MIEHTPAPWTYERDGDYWEIKPTGIGGKDNYEGNEADYKLAAAAPDMLAALEDIIKRNEIQHWFNLDQARAAVAKAKG